MIPWLPRRRVARFHRIKFGDVRPMIPTLLRSLRRNAFARMLEDKYLYRDIGAKYGVYLG